MQTTKRKPSFTHWLPMLDKLGFSNETTPPADYHAAYEKMLADASAFTGDMNMVMGDGYLSGGMQTEELWHSYGRPYFKVWPAMVDALSRTSMNFASEHFAVPFKAFSVMLPKTDDRCHTCLVSACRADEMLRQSVMADRLDDCIKLNDPSLVDQVRAREAVDGLRRRNEYMEKREEMLGPLEMQLLFFFLDTDGVVAFTHFYVHENQTIEEGLSELEFNIDRVDGDDRLWLGWSWPEVIDFVRISIGVAMFGVDRHELVAPDIDREELVARFPGGRSKGSRQLAAMRVAKEMAKCNGWRVGSEIDLPRPLQSETSVRIGTGVEREFGHYRSGHMRMQPCGEGGKDRKLIFVAPTLVRPDLPIRQSHGYRIRGKEAV